MFNSLREFERVVLSEKEVHIIELNRISTVLSDQMGENGGGTFRRLHTLFVSISSVDTAEAAIKRTADTGVMYRGAFAEERRAKIFFDRKTMERRPRKFIGPLHGPLCVIPWKPEDVFIGEAENRIERSLAAH